MASAEEQCTGQERLDIVRDQLYELLVDNVGSTAVRLRVAVISRHLARLAPMRGLIFHPLLEGGGEQRSALAVCEEWGHSPEEVREVFGANITS